MRRGKRIFCCHCNISLFWKNSFIRWQTMVGTWKSGFGVTWERHAEILSGKLSLSIFFSTRRPSFLKDFRHYVRCDNISSTYLCLWFAVKILFLKLFFDGFISCIDLYLFWNWVFGSYIYWSLRDCFKECRLCVFSLQFFSKPDKERLLRVFVILFEKVPFSQKPLQTISAT